MLEQQYGHSSVCQGQKGLWKPLPCAGSREPTWASKGRVGLAGRVQHFQGFLPSVMPRSVQPKSICSEGAESHQHKQEALSKKSLVSVVTPVQSCQKHKKASPPAKEQALALTAPELPPTAPALRETGTELLPWLPVLSSIQAGPPSPTAQHCTARRTP